MEGGIGVVKARAWFVGLVEDGMVESTNVSKAVHGSGRIGFGVNPHSSQLNRVNRNWTRNWPNVRFKSVGTGHWFSGLDPSIDFKSEAQQRNWNPQTKKPKPQIYETYETQKELKIQTKAQIYKTKTKPKEKSKSKPKAQIYETKMK